MKGVKITIQKGDSLLLLHEYPDNYFDSVVTDAPYGLNKEPDAIKLLQDWIDHGYHEVKGKGFMGKKWDAFVPQPVFWKEVFRVLKPGGYLLCFFGTRTYDWGTMAIRLAGFEIRDMITWHYGSGFPKSLDVSKAIDKAAGAKREVTGSRKKRGLGGSRVLAQDAWTQSQTGIIDLEITKPSTSKAKKYEGWGTALKPATEPICVARKPLCGTVAQNMILHGTGGINIDGCRVEFESDQDLKSATWGSGNDITGGNYNNGSRSNGQTNIEANSSGRFPANVIFDMTTAEILDQQTGILKSGKPSGKRSATNNIYGQYAPGQDVTGYGDLGGASRFFYCAKTTKQERNAGFDLSKKIMKTTSMPHDHENADWSQANGNHHETVKPIALMRYLQRLVTPRGGLTLDPFAGSGTSGCAAAFEGFDIVLMELDEKGTYIPIIEARTKYYLKVANRERYIKELKESQQILF